MSKVSIFHVILIVNTFCDFYSLLYYFHPFHYILIFYIGYRELLQYIHFFIFITYPNHWEFAKAWPTFSVYGMITQPISRGVFQNGTAKRKRRTMDIMANDKYVSGKSMGL